MNGQLFVVSLIAAIVWSAGCSQPPATLIDEPPLTVEAPLLHEEIVDAKVHVSAHDACSGVPTVDVCYYAWQPSLIFVAGYNESVAAIHLNVADSSAVIGPIEWILGCQDPYHTCDATLVKGTNDLPFAIDLDVLHLPASAAITLMLSLPSASQQTDLVQGFTSFAIRDPSVQGRIALASIPGAVMPPRQYYEFITDGHPGPCSPNEPNCTANPGGTGFFFTVGEGIVVHANVTMTWTATGPVDEELAFALSSPGSGTRIRATGPSPLTINQDVFLPGGIGVSVFPPSLTPYDPVANPVAIRTPVHIVWQVAFEPEPTDAK